MATLEIEERARGLTDEQWDRVFAFDSLHIETPDGPALLAYVRELSAGLNTKQRNALTGWPQHPRPKLSPELGEYGGYSNASFQKTPLGCAVLRVLEASC